MAAVSPNTFAFPFRQLFSVPYNFVLYMIENPGFPEGLEKLYQTCKCFFPKNSILISRSLECKRKHIFNEIRDEKFNTRIAKFWPIRVLYINIGSELDYTKFYRISPKYLHLRYTFLTLQDFNMLVAENFVTWFILWCLKITDANVDVILDKLPNVTNFEYNNYEEIWPSKTFEILNMIQRTPKFKRCELYISKLPPDFDPLLFLTFLLQNCVVDSCFVLFFGNGITEQKIVDVMRIHNKEVEGFFKLKLKTETYDDDFMLSFPSELAIKVTKK